MHTVFAGVYVPQLRITINCFVVEVRGGSQWQCPPPIIGTHPITMIVLALLLI